MAKGQLHSTGTVCKAERNCPLEGDGGQHFDTVDQLIEHTASETSADVAELREVIGTGVGPAEAVSMARDGVLGSATPASASKAPKRPATIEIDLSSATSDRLKDKFLENLGEMFPVTSVKTDGMGSYTVVVDAESDPDDYSVLMAASTAANNAATEMGYDEDELEDFEGTLSVSAEVAKAPAPQSVSWSYGGYEFTRSGLTAEEAQAKQRELQAEGIEASIS